MNIVIQVTKRIRGHYARKYLDDKPGVTVLDIGCADGYFGKSLKHAKTTGTDIKYGQDAEKSIDLPDNSFDYVTMLAVIEHFKDYKKAMKNIHKVLKPGGRVIITTPFHKAEKFISIYDRRAEDHLQHTKNFVKKDFIEMNELGFELVKYKTFELGLNQVAVLQKK